MDGRTYGQRENSIPTTNKVCGGYKNLIFFASLQEQNCICTAISYLEKVRHEKNNRQYTSLIETTLFQCRSQKHWCYINIDQMMLQPCMDAPHGFIEDSFSFPQVCESYGPPPPMDWRVFVSILVQQLS